MKSLLIERHDTVKKRLTLKKITLRNLDASSLEKMAGGDLTDCPCPTDTIGCTGEPLRSCNMCGGSGNTCAQGCNTLQQGCGTVTCAACYSVTCYFCC